MLKQISNNEIYLLIKYIKSVLWRVAKRLSYIQDARCLKVKKGVVLEDNERELNDVFFGNHDAKRHKETGLSVKLYS